MQRHIGLCQYRIASNPEEKRFAEAWAEQNEYGHTLEYILSPNNRRMEVNERDEQVAATIIQWLGSPVGRSFLQELGYENTKSHFA